MTNITKGSCLCGAVAYEISGPLRPSVACHCIQCRKTSGHYWSATRVRQDHVTVQESGALTWFRSSDTAKRGFCDICGANLFWVNDAEGDMISIGSGTIDGATGITTDKHIFTAWKGDYYTIEPGVPQRED